MLPQQDEGDYASPAINANATVCGFCHQHVYDHHAKTACPCGETFHTHCTKNGLRCPVCFTPTERMVKE